jgi:Flp pilus assembly protein TadG
MTLESAHDQFVVTRVECLLREGESVPSAWHRADRRLRTQTNDRGAAAVEFALVAVLLFTLVFGIAEFGRMWLLQSSLAAAARDAARTMAITNDQDEATAAAQAVFTTGDGPTVESITPDCDSSDSATVTLTYEAAFLTGFFTPIFGETITLRGEGVMRCGG